MHSPNKTFSPTIAFWHLATICFVWFTLWFNQTYTIQHVWSVTGGWLCVWATVIAMIALCTIGPRPVWIVDASDSTISSDGGSLVVCLWFYGGAIVAWITCWVQISEYMRWHEGATWIVVAAIWTMAFVVLHGVLAAFGRVISAECAKKGETSNCESREYKKRQEKLREEQSFAFRAKAVAEEQERVLALYTTHLNLLSTSLPFPQFRETVNQQLNVNLAESTIWGNGRRLITLIYREKLRAELRNLYAAEAPIISDHYSQEAFRNDMKMKLRDSDSWEIFEKSAATLKALITGMAAKLRPEFERQRSNEEEEEQRRRQAVKEEAARKSKEEDDQRRKEEQDRKTRLQREAEEARRRAKYEAIKVEVTDQAKEYGLNEEQILQEVDHRMKRWEANQKA